MFVLTSFMFAVSFADTRLKPFFLVARLQGSRIKSLGEGASLVNKTYSQNENRE